MVWPLELCRMWVLQLGHVVVFCQRKLVVFTWTNSSEPRPFLDRGSLFELAGFSQAYWAWPGLARPAASVSGSESVYLCVCVHVYVVSGQQGPAGCGRAHTHCSSGWKMEWCTSYENKFTEVLMYIPFFFFFLTILSTTNYNYKTL